MGARKIKKAPAPQSEPDTQKPNPLAPRSGFSYAAVSRILNDLTQALGELDGFAHRWATMVIDMARPYMKAHNATVAKHHDAKAYEQKRRELAADARRKNLDRIPTAKLEELWAEFPSYSTHVAKLLGSECEIEIRPFKSEWLRETATSPILSRLLLDLDLMDKPVAEAMEDLLYGDTKQ